MWLVATIVSKHRSRAADRETLLFGLLVTFGLIVILELTYAIFR